MHDIELIKKDPELFDRAMISRGFGEQAEKIIELDLKKRGSCLLCIPYENNETQ